MTTRVAVDVVVGEEEEAVGVEREGVGMKHLERSCLYRQVW
jgi:hypothetical protein